MSIRRFVRTIWDRASARFYCLRGDAHRHFGNSYGDLQEYWAAVEDYTRTVTLDPKHAQAYYNRGVLYWREIGNFYRAIQDLTRVIELNPNCADAYFNRGMSYKLHRQPEQAIADMEAYLARGQDPFWVEAAERQVAELCDEPGWEQRLAGRHAGSAGA